MASAVALAVCVGVESGAARADVNAVLACRSLPMGPARADCLERASADLEREMRGATAAPSGPGSICQSAAAALSPPLPAAPASASAALPPGAFRVSALTYQDGRPVFRLANGQVWAADERRRLTPRPGGDVVQIERSPGGMLLHFNGSFFALQVTRRD